MNANRLSETAWPAGLGPRPALEPGPRRWAGLPGWWALSVVAFCLSGLSQVTSPISTDGTLGPATPLRGPTYDIPHTLGQIREANLFHSFARFNVGEGERATFTGPLSVQNILARVTGGEGSSINGTVGSSIPGANLFLLNPSGIIFGPQARLDLSGDFTASTASYVTLGDGNRFDAVDQRPPVLSSAPPSAFGFLGGKPAKIEVRGSILEVDPGRSLSLLADGVEIVGVAGSTEERRAAGLRAPGGRIAVTAVNAAEEIPLTESAREPAPLAVSERGQVNIMHNAILDGTPARGFEAGGQVVIRAGKLVMDGAEVRTAAPGAAGNVSIAVADAVKVKRSHLDLSSGGQNAGQLEVRGETVELYDSDIIADTVNGRGGGVTVNANRAILASSSVSVGTSGAGEGGDVQFAVRDSLEVVAGLGVFSTAAGSGRAGNIEVTGREGPSGPPAGKVVINSQGKGLTGFRIDDYSPDNPGGPGEILVHAHTVEITGNAGLWSTRETSHPDPDATTSGNITVHADRLVISHGGRISANSRGPGSGPEVRLTGTDLRLDSGGEIESVTPTLGGTPVEGNAGKVAIDLGGTVTVADESVISVSAEGGNAGRLTVNAGSIRLEGGSRLAAKGKQGGIVTLATPNDIRVLDAEIEASGSGAGGGSVNLLANDLIFLQRAVVSGSTTGLGDAGYITFLDSRPLDLWPPLVVLWGSKLSARAGSGAGGEIRVETESLLSTASELSATSASGPPGRVVLPLGLDFSGPLAPVSVGLVASEETWQEAGEWQETGLGGYTRVGPDWETGFSRPRRLKVEDPDAGRPRWPTP